MFHVVTNHVKVSFAHIEGFIDETKTRINNKNRIIMKKILLSLVLLLCVCSVFGQDVEKLFEKYKAMPKAQYVENTENVRLHIKEMKKQGDPNISKKDFDYMLKSFKKSEQLEMRLDIDQKKQLEKELQALDGYEMLYMLNNNHQDGVTVIKVIDNTLKAVPSNNPDSQIYYYAKVNGDMVEDILIRTCIFNKVLLTHFNCKTRKDIVQKDIFNGGFIATVGEDEDALIGEAVELLKPGNVLFVFNGEEHPELCTEEEINKFLMSKYNEEYNCEQTWYVGEALMKHYPNTDRKIVVEFTVTPKENN